VSAGTIAGIVVGAVFLFSGALKLAAGRRWTEQAVELGTPRFAIPAVPWIEIVLGALLAAGVELPVTGLLAAALVAVFTVLLAVRLAQGRRPPCACFGRLSTRPIGPGSIVRNLILIALALVASLA
jgi:hypothetical protein